MKNEILLILSGILFLGFVHACPFCGDGFCNNCETCSTCPEDCGVCPIVFVCGDGEINQWWEECDDGNLIDGDGCSLFCKIEIQEEYCGDGFCNGEENKINCPQDCGNETNNICGDSILGEGEECDDGNNVDGDGCSADCKIEIVVNASVCGNGIIEDGEECDDGEDNGKRCDNDRHDCEYCSSSCKIVEREEKDDGDDDDDYKKLSFSFCEPNWKCDNWGACVDNKMKRNCWDDNHCEVEFNRPLEETGCNLEPVKIELPKQENNFPWIITLILALLVIGTLVGIVNKI